MPGKGSTFWFTAQFENPEAQEPETPHEHDGWAKLRVLIVDDNATSRQILRHQIFGWKLQKGSAAGGHEALRVLREAVADGHPYDIALLDIEMPEMDGLTSSRGDQGRAFDRAGSTAYRIGPSGRNVLNCQKNGGGRH